MAEFKGKLHRAGHLRAKITLLETGPLISLMVRIRREPVHYSTIEMDPAQARHAIRVLQGALDDWNEVVKLAGKRPEELTSESS